MTSVGKDELVAELAEAFLERVRAGELPEVEKYAAEHPECAADLLELLPLMLDVEGVGKTSMPPAPVMAHYPERLGDYLLLERIGSGGMGTVFRARQESLSRDVAVKILAPSWSTDSRIIESFENESRVIAGLRHTNIVEVFGAGHEGAYRYYVMGLVKGQGVSPGRLGAAFPGMPYRKAVAHVGLQAACALAFAHEHGVVHRDVKPGNLLMGNDGVLLVSDFGLATILNAGESAPLVAQSHDGTVRYMAPERLSGEADTFAGDQYSLGLTLYELLTRQSVFRNHEAGKLVQAICSGNLPPLKGHGELGAVVNKAISFQPKDRYESMQDMADDLQRVIDGVPVKARPTSLWRRYAMWLRRRPSVALWSHVAAALLVLLYSTITISYTRVKRSLLSENEQRERAEFNEQIADQTLKRIFSAMVAQTSADGDFLPPSRADVRLLQDLMPYYEQLASQTDVDDSQVTAATSILAAIALQTGDYSMAETCFRRAIAKLPPGERDHVSATIGLATAIFSSEEMGRTQEAFRLLFALEKQIPATADFETRLELVRALQLGARHARRFARGPRHQSPRTGDINARRRDMAEVVLGSPGDLAERAARLLAKLLPEQPSHPGARLLQAELLGEGRNRNVRDLLAPRGETALSLLEQLLKESPDSEVYKRAYVRLAVMPPGSSSEPRPEFRRAAEYALELLASSSADSELIMLFLSARDQYAQQLAGLGESQAARNERERTLGILSFVTARSDFTPAIRDRLVKWVALHYIHGDDASQHEQELRTLLRDVDAERIRSLRKRMLHMRRALHPRTPRRPGRGHFVPHSPSLP